VNHPPDRVARIHHPGSAANAAAWARRNRVAEHMRRCRALPRPDDAEVARMVAEFGARGVVTRCPSAFAGPVQAAHGRDAA
jgi:hypothetical protein